MDLMKRILKKFALLTLFAASILLSIPPWREYFFDGLGKHWDTKVMGYWMSWNAHNILQGNVLVPNFDANFFYPHLQTLAFGEMLWPESFIYAILWGPTHNLFFAFNGTMLIFWSLAGLCMYMLLREFNVCKTASLLAGFIYCLTPLMMAYYIEFNMTLIFVIPLFLLLSVRWLNHPTLTRALGVCAGFFVALTSCIYYTFMLVFPLACLVVAHLYSRRELLRQKRFYLSAMFIVAGVLLISAIYLPPYMQLRHEGGYSRNMSDFMISHAQPLMYIDTRSSAFIWHLFTPPRRWAETYLFPGTVLALLSLLYWGRNIQLFIADGKKGQFSIRTAIGSSKFVLWSMFWLIVLLGTYFHHGHWVPMLESWLLPVSAGLLVLYLCSLFLCRPDLSSQKIFLAGIAAGAVICFFISLGPVITTGPDNHLIKLSPGPFSWFFQATPVFDAVRGLTRFAIVVLFYLIVASSFMLDRIIRSEKRLVWCIPILIAILVYEGQHMKYRYKHYAGLVHSSVMEQARNLPSQSVLFHIPTTPKFIDTNIVMNTIGDFHYLVNGMSGFIPKGFDQLRRQMRNWEIDAITHTLRQIWPPVYLVLDRHATRWLANGWRKPFPWQVLDRNWLLLGQDQQYALYQLRSRTAQETRIIRRVRSDVLKQHALLTFSAHSLGDAGKEFRILLNGMVIRKEELSVEWQDYKITLPVKFMGRLDGDEVSLELMEVQSDDCNTPISSWEVRNIFFADV
jgi:hypothetical protein